MNLVVMGDLFTRRYHGDRIWDKTISKENELSYLATILHSLLGLQWGMVAKFNSLATRHINFDFAFPVYKLD